MFMRFVNLKVKEGRLNDFARFYEERTIPALRETKGCLYASLLKPTADDVECVSMTMWRSREDCRSVRKERALRRTARRDGRHDGRGRGVEGPFER